MKCQIKNCNGQARYFYDWEQSTKKELVLCVYCHYQLLGEMMKQQMLEKMAEAMNNELDLET